MIVWLLVACQSGEQGNAPAPDQYAALVNTRLGTQGKGFEGSDRHLEAGFTFPGAMYPFGMVQFTPTFFDPQKGFVINQLSGAGCDHMGNLPTLPVAGALQQSPNDMLQPRPAPQIDTVMAGYYKATLPHQHIVSELTVTPRTGMATFTFAEPQQLGTIMVGTGLNGTAVQQAHATITGGRTFEGYASGGSFCGYNTPYTLYFAGEFEQTPVHTGAWQGPTLQADAQKAVGPNSGLYFTFNVADAAAQAIRYKVGISYVSVQNAKENLAAENPDWDFEATRQAAATAWNHYLGKIAVSGGSADHTTQFYTHLYHAFAHPSIFSDVNGQYTGADGQVHTAQGYTYYTAFSNWDTYRTQIQLISMLAPQESSDMIQSIIQFAKQSGGGWPRWVLANIETGIMQGDPTSALVANAYAYGATDFDVHAALSIMRRGAEVPGTQSQRVHTRPHLQEYLRTGFTYASMSLEYNNADFAIAQFALQALHDTATYQTYLARAQSWKKLYNPQTQWLQARRADGTWKKPNDDMREASYKSYFWMVPYNLQTLIDTIGGPAAADKRLDEYFHRLDANYEQPWFAAGNEPDFQVPWVYNWLGKPYKTQALVRKIITTAYHNRASGLPGNDDLGAMGAWYVFANMGLYPMIPGVGGFAINSPAFPNITLQVPQGTLHITGGSEAKPYIQSLTWHGQPWPTPWVSWQALQAGGTLAYTCTEAPNTPWGAQAVLPSFNVGHE